MEYSDVTQLGKRTLRVIFVSPFFYLHVQGKQCVFWMILEVIYFQCFG